MLSQSFYFRDTKTVARDLLGKTLCFRKSKNEIFRGVIVETEAYLGLRDPACHSFHGKLTERAKTLYLPGGHSYVYMIYGLHHCLNVVTGDEQHPEAVLIRALQPLQPREAKTQGPGRLCKAWGITREQNALSLFSKDTVLWIEEGDFTVKRSDIVKTKRIGIDFAGEAADWPLRFYLKGNPHVSRLK